MKLAVCMGYWDGDKAMAQDVAVLLADLIPMKSHIVQFVFMGRHDASSPGKEIVNHVARKFTSVHIKRCPIVGFGHPSGCNAIAFSLFRMFRTEKAFDGCEAFLILESDCVVTRPSWDIELWDEWERTKGLGKLVFGHAYQGCDGDPIHGHHINAVAMYSAKIAELYPAIGRGKMSVGHDYANGPTTYPLAIDSPLIFMDYRKPTITREELFAPRKAGKVPLIFHGTRDRSALELVRKEYNV